MIKFSNQVQERLQRVRGFDLLLCDRPLRPVAISEYNQTYRFLIWDLPWKSQCFVCELRTSPIFDQDKMVVTRIDPIFLTIIKYRLKFPIIERKSTFRLRNGESSGQLCVVFTHSDATWLSHWKIYLKAYLYLMKQGFLHLFKRLPETAIYQGFAPLSFFESSFVGFVFSSFSLSTHIIYWYYCHTAFLILIGGCNKVNRVNDVERVTFWLRFDIIFLLYVNIHSFLSFL